MKISIVIPTFNRRKLLERSVRSVLGQDGDFEIIVVNDASRDDTEEYVRQFEGIPNFKYLKQEKNRGVNVARNVAIKNARGEWIACLDDDDEFLPNALEIISSKITDIPNNIHVLYFNSVIDTGILKFEGGFQFNDLDNKQDFYDPTYEETMTKFNLIGDCKPVFRRSLFKDEKYFFPEAVNGFESYTMSLLARDLKGIRYFKNKTTLIHQETELKDRLSINAPKKNPWPLLVLHCKQIFQHFRFYFLNPKIFWVKIITIIKLLVRSVLT